MVFPHRACGSAAGAAPIPVYGLVFLNTHSKRRLGEIWTRVLRPEQVRPRTQR